MARGRQAQPALVGIDDAVEQRRHRAAGDLAGESVHALEHQRRAQALERVSAQRILESCHPCRGIEPVTDDVADRDPGMPVAQRDHVVPIAAHLSVGRPGYVAGRDLQPGQLGETLGQQAALQGLSDLGDVLDFLGGATQTLERGADDRVATGRFVDRPLPFARCSLVRCQADAECKARVVDRGDV
jgi:hypothetical protein